MLGFESFICGCECSRYLRIGWAFGGNNVWELVLIAARLLEAAVGEVQCSYLDLGVEGGLRLKNSVSLQQE